MDGAILLGVTALTRFVFRSRYLYDLDSVNFALGLRRFDPSVHQPHPPGYFLYVYLGRLVNLAFHDANSAFVAISIVFSCAVAAVVYLLADKWFGQNPALFATLIFVFSPLAWFHGTVALTYIVEAFFSALTGYLCWRTYCGEVQFILPSALTVGISAGFRPSSLLLLGPLLLFSFCGTSRRRVAVGMIALALTILAWFIPMVSISGGPSYFSSLISAWLMVPSRRMVFNSSIFNSIARGLVIVGIYFLCFGCAAILPVLGLRKHSGSDGRRQLFTLIWIAPGLLFFTFVYLKFVNSGYLLLLVPPACAWMGLWASNWYANSQLRWGLKILIIAICTATNGIIFLFAPVYCSYREVRRFESELTNIIRVLPQIVSPRNTLIVGFDSHFLGYRHAGYYLPSYFTVQFPEVQLASVTQVFVMQNRDTHLESRLPRAPFDSFIIFPLPSGDKEYRDYLTLVRKRFPLGQLRTFLREGREYSIGPITDLPILFPVCASQSVKKAHGR